ncbi:MAG: 2'-5' RNA ligase family protein, partial [Actinomycetota bacterium]|nr:2'-5' RNA ligase family protein [Actinomycetota bacterium]
RLDPSAAWGVPAHLTVLYPFLSPERVDAAVLATLAVAVRSVPGFEVAFSRIGWFDEAVVWLAPEPAQPFRDLTLAVWRQFPETPPYAGAYPDLAPHLTIGEGAPVESLRQEAERVAQHLPIRTTVEVVQLICGSAEPASWSQLAEFPLGPTGQSAHGADAGRGGCA